MHRVRVRVKRIRSQEADMLIALFRAPLSFFATAALPFVHTASVSSMTLLSLPPDSRATAYCELFVGIFDS